MRNVWIKCGDGMPRLKRCEPQIDKEMRDGTFGDWAIYYSDKVAVLYSDGYITVGIYQVFDYEDLTKETFFMINADDQDEHGEAIAWAPLGQLYPEWLEKRG